MIDVQTVKVSIPLRRKFVISKGSATTKTNVLTILNNRYPGEASGSVHSGPGVPDIESGLVAGMEFIRQCREIDLKTLDDLSHLDIPAPARSALIAMLVNYISGETRRYPWEVLSLGTPVGIRSSFTISIDTPENMIRAIKDCDYPIIKVKMGQAGDSELLEALTGISGKTIRVDANGAWDCATAEEMIFKLAAKGVAVIEQPTDREFIKEWPHLKGKNDAVELIMDEGLNSLDDYTRYAEFIDGVNIKMEKCGGILEGIRIARRAREDGKKVMLGCMVESSVGIAQSVYMSSQADYFDLDGPLLLEDDIASGIRYDKESIEVDREIIGGPKLKREIIEKYISE
jgi:L-alanine-DL-glutamate epimerase-like enolase superfamily enzyme